MISSQISRYICNISHNYHPLSSLLLLRISPNFFDYSGSTPMCLSSLNRSNPKAFRHIMPYSAPLCKALHYSKTGLPWQMKSTLIIIFFLLKCLVLPYFTHFFDFFKSYSFPETVAKVAKYGSLRPSVVVCSSQLVVSLGGADYRGF